jgi:DNA-binding transcriptional LysR family regulator
MDRFDAMAMLVAAVDHGSLSAAARALKVPVPTLSRKVSDLEALLGTQLLTRTTRKLSLTDAGQAYVDAARRILEQVEEAERAAAGEFVAPRGTLVVTAPVLFGRLHVLPVVCAFLAMFPEIDVRLMLGDGNADLVEDHIDMAVRIGPLPDSGLIATRIGEMRAIVCASPSVIAGHGVPRRPEDLASRPSIATNAPLWRADWRFRDPQTGAAIDAKIRPRLTTSSEAAAEAAERGAGFVRLLHYQAFEALRAGRLVRVLEAFEPDPAPVHLVHVPRAQMPLKMRSFIDFAAPRLRRRLAVIAGTVAEGDAELADMP